MADTSKSQANHLKLALDFIDNHTSITDSWLEAMRQLNRVTLSKIRSGEPITRGVAKYMDAFASVMEGEFSKAISQGDIERAKEFGEMAFKLLKST